MTMRAERTVMITFNTFVFGICVAKRPGFCLLQDFCGTLEWLKLSLLRRTVFSATAELLVLRALAA